MTKYFPFFHRYTSGTTHTADALKYARETAFKTQNGMRPNAAKIAIVITDGKSGLQQFWERGILSSS